jgi:glycerol-3-phosphate acyltransferase PlsY
MERIGCILIGYAFGSFLTAELVARVLGHESAFSIGDGNPGMANIGRHLGKPAALAVLVGDIMKTVAAVLISRTVFPQLENLSTAWAGLGATLGHVFPFWHRFKGGKGVTTIASTIILMNPFWGIIAGVVGVSAIVVSGYLSVAAVVSMGFYAVAMLATGHPEFAFVSVVFQILTVYCHWSKIKGIKDGTTHRAGLSIRFWEMVRRK